MLSLIPRSVLLATLNSMSWVKSRPFERSLGNAIAEQRNWLLRRIVECRETRFGRDHGFHDLRTVEDFRRRLPVGGYELFAPYIHSVAAGDTAALIPSSDRLIQFTITTGSTGTPKLNPVTAQWLREYQRGWDAWGMKLFIDHPRNLGRKVLQMAGTWDMGKTAGGYQISMVSALLARRQSPLLRPFYAIPEVLNSEPDPVARHYTALRLAIGIDIGWIILMNPGTLLKLAEIGDQNRETLIRDIRDGVLSQDIGISPSVRSALPKLTPDPTTARRLEGIVERTGRLLPSEYWNLPVIGCWLGGTAGFQSRYVHEVFGNVPMRDMGLVSSEGRHTIPLVDQQPYGVPSIGAGYYEFISVDEPDTILEGHELLPDHDYRMLITNAAGYFRFDVGDVVRCRGFTGQAPLLEFRQKYDRVGDLEGEKVTEHQVIEAAQAAANQLGMNLGLITAVPRRDDSRCPRYDFLVEIDVVPDPEQGQEFLRLLDQELSTVNFLWRARRREGVLDFPRLVRLPPNTWAGIIRQETEKRGTGDYQYKHPGLVRDISWVEKIPVVDVICRI